MAVISFHVNHLTVSGGRGAAVWCSTSPAKDAMPRSRSRSRTSLAPHRPRLTRDDLVHQEVANLPAWAHGDAAGFFARAEQHERANGRYATTWQLALPKELTREEQRDDGARLPRRRIWRDKPNLWVLHDPVNAQGAHQPHIHVLFSERTQ